jgi:hypothetical protein
MSKRRSNTKDGNGNDDELKYISEIRKKLQQQQEALQKIIENLKNDN